MRRGDTLSRIAGEYKPPGATLEQMLVALFDANQPAFDGNMNRLRAGAILNIPSPEAATATPAPEAQKTVRLQAADWRSYQSKVAAAAPASEGAGARGAGGAIGTTVEEKAPAASAWPRSAQGVAAGRQGRARHAGGRRGRGARQGAEGSADTHQRARKDAEGSAEGARAQGTARRRADAGAGGQGAGGREGGAAEERGPAPETKAPEPPKAAIPAPVEPPRPPRPPKAAAPAKAPAAKAEPAKKEGSWVDDLVGSTPGWVIGGGALAALAGVAALIAARRRRTVKFEDSIIGGTDIKTNTVFGSTGGGVVNTGENSLATDFSREGLGSIDTDEVDPIAEAEVYLAYGRDAQAEEILKDALKKDPHRQEIYVKLLEIHAQHNKPSAFETVAAELYSVSQGKGESWQKAVTLGRQLDPNNPMFGEGAGAAAAAAAAATGAGLALGAGAAHVAAASEQGQGHPARRHVALDREGAPGRQRARLPLRRGRVGLAHRQHDQGADRGDRRRGARIRGIREAPRGRREARGRQRREGRRGHRHCGRRAEGGAVAPPADLDFRLDPNTGGLLDEKAAKMSKDESVSPALARPQAAIDLDKLDLAFGPESGEHPTFEDPTPSVLDGQWHDAATKLDLAKAYQEMGDVEGAREILQEVLHEGDETQKAEAQVLLAKLG